MRPVGGFSSLIDYEDGVWDEEKLRKVTSSALAEASLLIESLNEIHDTGVTSNTPPHTYGQNLRFLLQRFFETFVEYKVEVNNVLTISNDESGREVVFRKIAVNQQLTKRPTYIGLTQKVNFYDLCLHYPFHSVIIQQKSKLKLLPLLSLSPPDHSLVFRRFQFVFSARSPAFSVSPRLHTRRVSLPVGTRYSSSID